MCRYFPNLSTSRLPLFLLAAGLTGCPDYNSGQDQEPDGPLLVTKLTLFDATSRDAPVFTDTSVPDCSKAENQDTLTCKADINRDTFNPKKSPPTPDSGREVRVVFNKLPAYFNGQEVERRIDEPGKDPQFVLADPAIVEVSCTGCAGAPPVKETLILSGSDTTSDPTYPGSHPANIPYGPAILLEATADAMHPYAALEPETAYTFRVKAALAGRNHQGVQVTPQQQDSLLTITTEPYQLLRVGIGDATGDSWVYGKPDSMGPATFTLKSMATDGVISVTLNAPIDEASLKATTATATRGGTNVPLKIGLSQLVMKAGKPACDPGKHRALYLFPVGGSWGNSGEIVTISVKGADVRDVSQAAGNPAGRHTLRGDLAITATLSGKAADAGYKGLAAAKVSATADCPM